MPALHESIRKSTRMATIYSRTALPNCSVTTPFSSKYRRPVGLLVFYIINITLFPFQFFCVIFFDNFLDQSHYNQVLQKTPLEIFCYHGLGEDLPILHPTIVLRKERSSNSFQMLHLFLHGPLYLPRESETQLLHAPPHNHWSNHLLV